MQRSAEFVVACSNAAELLELIEEAFDVVDLSGQVGFAQLDAYSSTEINDAPIKTEEIAATEFNDDITMSNVTLGRNGNDISRAYATMSSGKFASLPPSCKTGGLRHRLCVRSVASLPNFTLRYSTSPAQPSNESATAL